MAREAKVYGERMARSRTTSPSPSVLDDLPILNRLDPKAQRLLVKAATSPAVRAHALSAALLVGRRVNPVVGGALLVGSGALALRRRRKRKKTEAAAKRARRGHR